MILLILITLPSVAICNDRNPITRHLFFDRDAHLDEFVCFTKECVQTASRIKSWMNETMDPCENFFNFVCGEYGSSNIKASSPFTSLNIETTKKISQILQNNAKNNESYVFRIAKNVFKKCITEGSEQEINQNDSFKSSQNVISSIEQWPLFNGTQWDINSWSWINAIHKLRRTGLPFELLFGLSLIRDQKNTSKMLLKLDSPEYFNTSVNVAQMLLLHEVLYNFSKSEIRSNTTIQDFLEFEQILLLATNMEAPLSSLYTVKKFQMKFNYLNWIEIIELLLGDGILLKKDTEVFVNNILYFTELRKILKRTPKRMIANYFFLKTLLFMTRHNSKYLQLHLHGTLQESTELRCTLLTKQLLPVSVNALYARTYFSELPKDAIRIAINIRRQLKRMIKRSDLLDSSAKIHALEKLESMHFQLGYPDDYLNDTKIEKYFSGLKLNENGTLIEDEMAINLFKTHRKFRQYKKQTKNVPKYSDVTMANCLYDMNRNAVSIPVSLLQSNIFGAKRPNFLNYASFGSIVAYAISSAFSLMSKDKKRNSVTLEDEIYDNFLNRTKCIEDQYKMVHNETRNYENIINSLVADMISMRASYLSYKDWSKRHIDELGLPFLRFTPNQLFWIRLVQNHCNKDRTTDKQAESQYRVNGILKNIIEFSEDFQCPLGTIMNGNIKCNVL